VIPGFRFAASGLGPPSLSGRRNTHAEAFDGGGDNTLGYMAE